MAKKRPRRRWQKRVELPERKRVEVEMGEQQVWQFFEMRDGRLVSRTPYPVDPMLLNQDARRLLAHLLVEQALSGASNRSQAQGGR